MTDQPSEADPGTTAEEDSEVEGHGRFGQFMDADGTIDDPYPTRPPGAPER